MGKVMRVVWLMAAGLYLLQLAWQFFVLAVEVIDEYYAARMKEPACICGERYWKDGCLVHPTFRSRFP
jgi:hypothetical protein